METTEINYDGITLLVEYDFEDADHSVGYDGGVQIHSIQHAGVEIQEIMSKSTIESIANEIASGY